MSFILDALRKAEDRNRNNHELSVPAGPQVLMDETPEPPPNWRKIIVLGICGLALLGAGVFLGLRDTPAPEFANSTPGKALTIDNATDQPGILMPGNAADAPSGDSFRAPQQATPSTTAAAPESAARPRDTGARALDREAARTRPQPSVQPGTATSTPQVTTDTTAFPARTRVRNETLPDYLTIVQSGQVALPQLHLDMHVYSAAPEKRLVFINLNKLKTGDKLDARTTIESIEPDGVIIDHKGFRFLLRPD